MTGMQSNKGMNPKVTCRPAVITKAVVLFLKETVMSKTLTLTASAHAQANRGRKRRGTGGMKDEYEG
jgi:hypothetical protein